MCGEVVVLSAVRSAVATFDGSLAGMVMEESFQYGKSILRERPLSDQEAATPIGCRSAISDLCRRFPDEATFAAESRFIR